MEKTTHRVLRRILTAIVMAAIILLPAVPARADAFAVPVLVFGIGALLIVLVLLLGVVLLVIQLLRYLRKLRK